MNMLLVFATCLFARMMAVGNACEAENKNYHDFDMNKFVGRWYWMWHIPNKYEDDSGCLIDTWSALDKDNISRLHTDTYTLSTKKRDRIFGLGPHWSHNSYLNIYTPPTAYDTTLFVIGANFDKFIAIRACLVGLDKPVMWVGFRNKSPDEATIQAVNETLKNNNVDPSVFRQFPVCLD